MNLKNFLLWAFALILIVAGINHFIHPAMYIRLIPNFLPLVATNYFTALVEIGLGVGLIVKPAKRCAAIGTMLLMVFFLPFHIFDALREQPAIGSHTIAWIRLVLQFVMIYWAWFLIPKAKNISANNKPLPPPK